MNFLAESLPAKKMAANTQVAPCLSGLTRTGKNRADLDERWITAPAAKSELQAQASQADRFFDSIVGNLTSEGVASPAGIITLSRFSLR
jgi:hypothetical protein